MRSHSVPLAFVAGLMMLGFCTAQVGAQTFTSLFGTGSWTSYGSVHSPQDDIWSPGIGPAGEFWTSPGGSWQPPVGGRIRNPKADQWTPTPGPGVSGPRSGFRTGAGRGDNRAVFPSEAAPSPRP